MVKLPGPRGRLSRAGFATVSWQGRSLDRLLEYAANLLRSPSESTQRYALLVRAPDPVTVVGLTRDAVPVVGGRGFDSAGRRCSICDPHP